MAKKSAKRDPRLAQGKKVLEEWGIQPPAGQDSSLNIASLHERIGQHADADLALAAFLGDVQTVESAQFLVSWIEQAADKRLHKEISRALYRLSQRGIQAERPQKGTGKSILTPVEPEGYISSMDGRGDRLVWIVKARVGGGLHFLSSLINEPEGMRYIEGTEISRKVLRQALQDLSANSGLTLIEAPWRYCDFLMQEGYERAKAQDRKEVESYPAVRSFVFTTPPERVNVSSNRSDKAGHVYSLPQTVPLPDSLDRQAIAADENLLVTSTQLAEEPEMQRWLFDAEQAKPYVEKISSAQESPLVLNQHQQKDRVDDVIKEAVAELFSGESGRTYARRLEETALYFAASGRLESAQRALAVSLALQKEGASGSGIPFCEGLVQQSIGLHYTEEKQHQQEESKGSLIMKPSEFAARAQQAQRQRRV